MKIVRPLNRSQGDVHPKGNPHFHLSPEHLTQAAKVIRDRLISADPGRAAAYNQGFENLSKELKAISTRVAASFVGIDKTKAVYQYHTEFSYFLQHYGLKNGGAIEEVPGTPPSAARLTQIAEQAKGKAMVALYAPYNPENLMQRFHEISLIPVRKVPLSLKAGADLGDYERLQSQIANAIVKP